MRCALTLVGIHPGMVGDWTERIVETFVLLLFQKTGRRIVVDFIHLNRRCRTRDDGLASDDVAAFYGAPFVENEDRPIWFAYARFARPFTTNGGGIPIERCFLTNHEFIVEFFGFFYVMFVFGQ